MQSIQIKFKKVLDNFNFRIICLSKLRTFYSVLLDNKNVYKYEDNQEHIYKLITVN